MRYSLIILFSFLISIFINYIIIYISKNKQIGQIERSLGLESHKRKNNTPTLGGIGIILAIILINLIVFIKYKKYDYKLILYLIVLLGYFLIGLIDDILIIKKKDNTGIYPSVKLFLEIFIALIFLYIYYINNNNTKINLLFCSINLYWVYGLYIIFGLIGFSNSTNLTDGMDGLLAGLLLINMFFLTFIIKNIYFLALIGACTGFLALNLPKAKIFMGDTGSLPLGALFFSICVLNNLDYLLLFFGFIYIIEALSVSLQVLYFKITKGKRLFKMAPIHHHYEIIFKEEEKVLLLFYSVSLLFHVVGYLLYYNF